MTSFEGLLIIDAKSKPFPGRLIVEGEKITATIPTAESKPQCYIAPGFIDAHTHPLETGLGMIYPDFSAARSIADVLEILKTSIERMPDSPIYLGFNLEPDRLKEHRYPYRRELDRLNNQVPVLIYRVDGHSAAVNSKALEALPETDYPGVEFDGAGKPTGVVRGKAYELLSANWKRLLPLEIIREAINFTARTAFRNGVVALGALVGSNELTENEWALLLDALGSAPIKMIPFLQTWKVEVAQQFSLSRIGGCLLVDGSFGSHTAALFADYADAIGYQGVLYQEDSKIIDFLLRAIKMKLQTAFHAIGDRAVSQIVRCHEQVACQTLKEHLRHRIEHAELLSSDLVKRIAALDLIVCVQPSFEIAWGGPQGMYAKRLGERWRYTNPYRTLFDNKIVVAGGSDAPITPINPLHGIYAAMNLPNESQRLTGPEALALFTENAAYSLGIENVTGRLESGMEANFVILSGDPRTDFSARILATYYRGQMLFSASPAT